MTCLRGFRGDGAPSAEPLVIPPHYTHVASTSASMEGRYERTKSLLFFYAFLAGQGILDYTFGMSQIIKGLPE